MPFFLLSIAMRPVRYAVRTMTRISNTDPETRLATLTDSRWVTKLIQHCSYYKRHQWHHVRINRETDPAIVEEELLKPQVRGPIWRLEGSAKAVWTGISHFYDISETECKLEGKTNNIWRNSSQSRNSKKKQDNVASPVNSVRPQCEYAWWRHQWIYRDKAI